MVIKCCGLSVFLAREKCGGSQNPHQLLGEASISTENGRDQGTETTPLEGISGRLTGGRALWQHCACPRAEVAARPEQSAEAPAGGVRGSVSAAATGRPGTEALSRAGRRRTAGGAVRRGEEAAAVASAGEGRWEGGLWRRDGAAGAVELGGEVPAGPGSFPSGAQPGVRLWLRRLPAGGGLGRAQRGERGGRLGGRRPLWSRGRVLCAAGVEAAGAVLRLSLARCERMKHGGRQRKQAQNPY